MNAKTTVISDNMIREAHATGVIAGATFLEFLRINNSPVDTLVEVAALVNTLAQYIDILSHELADARQLNPSLLELNSREAYLEALGGPETLMAAPAETHDRIRQNFRVLLERYFTEEGRMKPRASLVDEVAGPKFPPVGAQELN